ncbi:hypothetical protein HanPSC8_Chr16g0694931 [Helianthus annuus]|nr:hypothetical protein HanIR_Chr16g0788341 [Helianthus annuus]KAJ0819336.1 hypothetical protein HanPSC8_Chr16g0694931 [Helianthus annuus]
MRKRSETTRTTTEAPASSMAAWFGSSGSVRPNLGSSFISGLGSGSATINNAGLVLDSGHAPVQLCVHPGQTNGFVLTRFSLVPCRVSVSSRVLVPVSATG